MKQKDLDVASYIEEFQKLYVRSKVQEEETIKVARYLSGLKWNIQEEISLWTSTTIQKCHQLATKVEERNKRKGDSNNRGRGRGRDQMNHRGGYQSKESEQRNQGESKLTEHNSETTLRGGHSQGRGAQGGPNRSRGTGRGNSYFATMKCYNCGQLGHLAYICPDKPTSSNSGKRVAYAHEDTSSRKTPEVDHIELEIGENQMFNRVLIRQPVKDEPKHRRALFRVRCKILGKVCKVIVDSGSTNNIILDEAAKKLKLTKIPHTNPYR